MSSSPEPSEYEGTVYRSARAWAFKICRAGCDELVQQDDFGTRQDAQAECQRQLVAYDPAAKVINHYKFSASLELTVEGDTLEEATAVAEEELHQISESLDQLWWSRNGASRYSLNFTRHRYEE